MRITSLAKDLFRRQSGAATEAAAPHPPSPPDPERSLVQPPMRLYIGLLYRAATLEAGVGVRASVEALKPRLEEQVKLQLASLTGFDLQPDGAVPLDKGPQHFPFDIAVFHMFGTMLLPRRIARGVTDGLRAWVREQGVGDPAECPASATYPKGYPAGR